MNNKAFSITELLMVLVVVGILCFAAIPTFYHLQSSQRQAQLESIGIELRMKLKERAKNSEVAPVKTLDAEKSQQNCLACFANVLGRGVNNALWFKEADNHYYYSLNGNVSKAEDYKEPGDYELRFDAQTQSIVIRVLP